MLDMDMEVESQDAVLNTTVCLLDAQLWNLKLTSL